MKQVPALSNWKLIMFLALSLVGLKVLAAACGGKEKTSAPTLGTAEGGLVLAAHKAGETHAFLPKRLEAAVEIDMYEFYFANPQGEKNPVYRLPAGKTVGIHTTTRAPSSTS